MYYNTIKQALAGSEWHIDEEADELTITHRPSGTLFFARHNKNSISLDITLPKIGSCDKNKLGKICPDLRAESMDDVWDRYTLTLPGSTTKRKIRQYAEQTVEAALFTDRCDTR